MADMIPVLAVRQPWAGLIESRRKTTEVRRYPAPKKYLGQKIAIYASRTRPVSSEVKHIQQTLYLNEPRLRDFVTDTAVFPESCLFKGFIIAVATLKSSVPCISRLDFACWQSEHWNPLEYYEQDKTHYWNLGDIQPLADPVPFKFSGSMVWSSIEKFKLAEFLEKDL